MSEYDSSKDTLLHIKRINELLLDACVELMERAKNHDSSKLSDHEKPFFDVATPLLKTSTYGSEEYTENIKLLGNALDHHYANNRHHTQFHENGINDMNLFDLMEMFFDWKAAGERHDDGNIYKSIDINKTRYSMSKQLAKIFENTAKYLNYK